MSAGNAALGLLFVLIWASAFTSARFVVLEWPALWSLAIRFALTAPLVALIILALRGRIRLPARQDAGRLLLMGVFGTGGYLGCAWMAMATTPSGLVALISATAPLFVAGGERLFFGRRLAPQAWLGLALGWAGVATLGLWRAGTGLAAAEATGILLSLAGALSQAVGILAYAQARGRVDAWTSTLGQSLTAAIVLLPLAALIDGPAPRTIDATVAAGMAWSILAVGLAGYALFFTLMKRLPASTAAALQLLSPPVAALLGWALLSERLLPGDILGGVVTLAGLALLFSARRA
jgi:drug/metabolite transporter (DMT)-like permease